MSSSEPSPKRQRGEESPVETEEPSVKGEIVVKNYGVRRLSDVCLVVGNAEFHVHKMILANRSKFFETLFFGDFKEKDEDRIEIHDVDPLSFERMLDVIYDLKLKSTNFFACGEKAVNTSQMFWEQVGNLWKAFDRFDVDNGRDEFLEAFTVNWCKPVDGLYKCSFCVNRFIFCYILGLNVTGTNDHSPESISEWAEKHFEGVPEMLAGSAIQKLLLRMAKSAPYRPPQFSPSPLRSPNYSPSSSPTR